LCALYPLAPRGEVMQALPGRTWKAIGLRAMRLDIRRDKSAAYGEETRRKMSEDAIRKYQECPELRKHLSKKTKELYRKGILKSPLASLGNGYGPTPYERLAWVFLEPLGFVREYPVSSDRTGPPYKLDFAHPELKIDVEIDGKQHRETRVRERDETRDQHLASLGWRVIRIANDSITSVLLGILERRLPK